MNAPRMSSLTMLALALALAEPRKGTAADRKPQPEAEPSVDTKRVINSADAYADLHGLPRQTGMNPAHQRKRSRILTNDYGGQVVLMTDSCEHGEPLLVLTYLSDNLVPNITLALTQFASHEDRDEMFDKVDGPIAAAIFTNAMYNKDGSAILVAVPIG